MHGRRSIPIIVALLLVPSSSFAATISDFEGGILEKTANLADLELKDRVNFSLPAECHVLNATVKVGDAPAPGSACADGVSLLLNGSVLWAFNSTGAGALGRQTLFSDGADTAAFSYGSTGGSDTAYIRIPKEAVVKDASIAPDCRGPNKAKEIMHVDGTGMGGELGTSVASAGDLNGDGHEDFIVGDPGNRTNGLSSGAAYVYYGGPYLDGVPELAIFGQDDDGMFGYIVAGAGDLNGDGYDDLMISAPSSNVTGYYAGRVAIYYGGPKMDTIPDVPMTGNQNDGLGWPLAEIGDVNGDGFDDVLIGAPYNSTNGGNSGLAFLYFGGSPMDNVPDVVFKGDNALDFLGGALAGLGDINGDGHDDFIIGSPGNSSMGYSGVAHLYFGGSPFDAIPDVIFLGQVGGEGLGNPASAGDVNGDGYNDVLMGVPGKDGSAENSGGAYIYYGGTAMDTLADVKINGVLENERLGAALCCAGDINGDGYDDVILGGTDTSSDPGQGIARVYLGGAKMDSGADFTFVSSGYDDRYGSALSGAGDVNDDGFDDFLIGAPRHWFGQFFVYTCAPYMTDPWFKAGGQTIWTGSGLFVGNRTNLSTQQFLDALSGYIRTKPPSGRDSYGNWYVDIPMECGASSSGKIFLSNLNIQYTCNFTVLDFAGPLNDFIAGHQNEKDPAGMLDLSFEVVSRTPGALRLYDLNITFDEPPLLVMPIPDAAIDEDTANRTLVDLFTYFSDDYDLKSSLTFSVVSASSPNVTVSIYQNRYVSVDAQTIKASHNWTGNVYLSVSCADQWGQTTVSNQFTIEIRNVNDPPVFISRPPLNATVGLEYSYQPVVADGDGDSLIFGLAGDPAMTIDASDGHIGWYPTRCGLVNITISVMDGNGTTFQNFTVDVYQPNRAPRITSTPIQTARVGELYLYNVISTDDDGDQMDYSVKTPATGLAIDRLTGSIYWTPARAGVFPVAITVSDGNGGETIQVFNITISEALSPRIKITFPHEGQSLRGKVRLNGTVTGGTFPLSKTQIRIDGKEWQDSAGLESWNLMLDTTKLKNGKHMLEVQAIDVSSYSGSAQLNFTVANPEGQSGGVLTVALGITIVVILAIAAGIVLLARKRKAGREPPIPIAEAIPVEGPVGPRPP